MQFTYLPEVVSIGDLDLDPVWALKAHAGSSHELLHVVSGRLELQWEEAGKSFVAEAGDSLLNPAGILHRDQFDLDSGLQILIIHFHWQHFAEYNEVVSNSNINKLSDSTKGQLRRLFDDLRMDSGPGENDRQLAGARLLQILMLIYRECATEHYPEDKLADTEHCRHRIVDAAKKYLERNFQHPLRLEDVASELEISTFYLSRIFSSESDFSLVQYLTDVRINEAKKLLRENRHIISDIATMTGFESAAYFSRVFKKIVGCSPSSYGKIKK